jgi:hypothetical protein
MATNDLCVACNSLVGGNGRLVPHPELRQVKTLTESQLFQCVACDAWWRIEKLGWNRLISQNGA